MRPWSSRALRRFLSSCLLLLACLTALASNPGGAPATGRFSADNIFDIEFALDPQISPDGARVVYVRQYSDRVSDNRYSNLWIVDADGRNHRPLTGGKQRDRNARWSPDGGQLVYVSDRDGSPQLHVLDVATGRSRRLTSMPGPVARPAWSPDGSRVAFFSEVVAAPRTLAKMPAPPPGAKWRERARIHDQMVFRRDQIGYLRGFSHLFVIDGTGGQARQLSSGDFNHGAVGAAEWEDAAGIAWSADSRMIVVAANRRPDAENEPFDTELYEFNADTGAMRAVTDRRGPDQSPSVSPDGGRLAYVGYDDRRLAYQTPRAYVARADGTESRLLTGSLDAAVRMVTWTPDSRGLYFLHDHHGRTLLAYQPINGAMTDVIGNVGAGYMNYGFAAAYSVARNGRIAYTYEDAHTTGALAVWDPRTRKAKTILRLNEDWLGRKSLASVEEIWFRSSFDGRLIQGWIMKPPDFDPSRKYPLILEIHGGPQTNIGGDRFDIEKQLYAASGYVVLFMNPRGSTSYGEEFTNLIHHKYPGDDYYDLMSGVDTVIARGYIDESNLFITGGSGGGVLTCWVIGQTARFAAAVSQYGYVNAVSQALSSDIPWITRYWFSAFPWEKPEEYWARSPLSLVGNVKTPTMMMVGLEEVRAPPWESEQFFKALRLRGVESVLVNFPDEPHGIRIYPSHHVEKVLTILAWFDGHRRN